MTSIKTYGCNLMSNPVNTTKILWSMVVILVLTSADIYLFEIMNLSKTTVFVVAYCIAVCIVSSHVLGDVKGHNVHSKDKEKRNLLCVTKCQQLQEKVGVA